MDGSLSDLLGPSWGRARGGGTSWGYAVFSHCPNTVLCFVSPAELCRLHHGREEAEEWAAPQIVSMGGSGWVPSLPQVSPLHKTVQWKDVSPAPGE